MNKAALLLASMLIGFNPQLAAAGAIATATVFQDNSGSTIFDYNLENSGPQPVIGFALFLSPNYFTVESPFGWTALIAPSSVGAQVQWLALNESHSLQPNSSQSGFVLSTSAQSGVGPVNFTALGGDFSITAGATSGPVSIVSPEPSPLPILVILFGVSAGIRCWLRRGNHLSKHHF